MNITRAYYYLFYKFYKVAMTGAVKSFSAFYAGVGIMALEIWFLLSLYNYYSVFINRHATLELVSFKVIFSFMLILIINYLSFTNSTKWKDYLTEFDQWPKNKNILGTWIVIMVVAFILFNLIFSFYLTSLVDWKQYR